MNNENNLDNIRNIKEMVTRKKREGLILWLLITIFCFANIIINIDVYKNVVFNSYKQISSLEDIKKDDKFMTIDLTKAKKENYLLELNNDKANIYTLNLNGTNVLVVTTNNTIATDKVIVEKYDNESLTNDIRLKFPEKKYDGTTFSNINCNKDINIELGKIYTLFGFFILGLIFAIKNLIQMINPTKTKMYKKLYKKLYTE